MCDSSIAYGVIALGIKIMKMMVEKEMKKDQYYRSRDELIEMRLDRERGVYLLRW